MFISLEGIDGCGKTTQVSLLSKKFLDFVFSKEPDSSFLGPDVRRCLNSIYSNPKSNILSIYSARVIHIEKLIKPALESGSVVVCDRFIDSSIAYLCADPKISYDDAKQIVHSLHNLFISYDKDIAILPDKTFFLDLEPEDAALRLGKRAKKEKMDDMSLDCFKRIRNAFCLLAKENPNRIIKIDASQDPDKVNNAISQEIENFLQQKKL